MMEDLQNLIDQVETFRETVEGTLAARVKSLRRLRGRVDMYLDADSCNRLQPTVDGVREHIEQARRGVQEINSALQRLLEAPAYPGPRR